MTPGDTPAGASRAPAAACPTCGGPADPSQPNRPFCSARCRWIDLGRWLDGEYAVPGEPAVAFENPREDTGDERDA